MNSVERQNTIKIKCHAPNHTVFVWLSVQLEKVGAYARYYIVFYGRLQWICLILSIHFIISLITSTKRSYSKRRNVISTKLWNVSASNGRFQYPIVCRHNRNMNWRQAHQTHFPLSSSMLCVNGNGNWKQKCVARLPLVAFFLSFSRFRTLCYHTLQLHPTCLLVGSVAQLIIDTVWFSQDRAFVPIAIAQSSTDFIHSFRFAIENFRFWVARRMPNRLFRAIEKKKKQHHQQQQQRIQ